MKIDACAFTITALLLCAGCSSGDNQAASKSGGEHVWKEQVGTANKAKDAEKAVMDAAAKQAEAVQQQAE